MKKFILSLGLVALTFTCYADINGSGYYRVKNYGSSRWAALVDNKGSVDFVAGSADLHALYLTNNTEEILSDPASIVYITPISGAQCDISAQGTTLSKLVDTPINIGADGSANGQSLYRIWGTYQNITKYIGDGNLLTDQETGDATIQDLKKYPNFMKWFFIPVNVNSDNFFGAAPTVEADGQLYSSVYASFAYTPYSENVKAYYAARVGFGMVELVEITDGVPASAPVVIQCAGKSTSDNKMQIIQSAKELPGNVLKGVYFDYKFNNVSNQVAYDPQTMRVLGNCADGSLGFVTADIKYIPANTAYLLVPAGSSPEFKCVTSEEFEANIPDAPEQLYISDELVLTPQGDYTYSGNFNLPEVESSNFTFHIYSSGTEDLVLGAYSPTGNNVVVYPGISPQVPFVYGSEADWVIPNWTGGDLAVSVNLLYGYVSLYSKNAGIDSIEADNGGLLVQGNLVLVNNPSQIQVYDLNGKKLAQHYGTTLDISSLPKGVLIIKAGNQSIKIIH
ncbi:MAG: T9SS type A sorting domain-containing protein [Muribaculaceae bacterium]|nr:T9SS type A sorting domain-containing protein [Muribaculaceae bacterium]